MPNELIILGGVGGTVAVICFGKAVMDTIRIGYLQVVEEPVPEKFLSLINGLGGENANNSQDSRSS